MLIVVRRVVFNSSLAHAFRRAVLTGSVGRLIVFCYYWLV